MTPLNKNTKYMYMYSYRCEFHISLQDGRKGEWLFRLEESDGLRSAAAQCNSWLSEQNRKIYDKIGGKSVGIARKFF